MLFYCKHRYIFIVNFVEKMKNVKGGILKSEIFQALTSLVLQNFNHLFDEIHNWLQIFILYLFSRNSESTIQLSQNSTLKRKARISCSW